MDSRKRFSDGPCRSARSLVLGAAIAGLAATPPYPGRSYGYPGQRWQRRRRTQSVLRRQLRLDESIQRRFYRSEFQSIQCDRKPILRHDRKTFCCLTWYRPRTFLQIRVNTSSLPYPPKRAVRLPIIRSLSVSSTKAFAWTRTIAKASGHRVSCMRLDIRTLKLFVSDSSLRKCPRAHTRTETSPSQVAIRHSIPT